jgi:hypothetical protein
MVDRPPRPARIRALEDCTIAREDGHLVAGVLVNISEEGFCVESGDSLAVGEAIEIRMSSVGRIHGIVRWFDDHRAGAVVAPYTKGACEADTVVFQSETNLSSS